MRPSRPLKRRPGRRSESLSFYETFLRPLLFRLDPETAHDAAVSALDFAGQTPGMPPLLRWMYSHEDPALETEVAGLRFANPVGLAAGFDKDCRLAGILPSLGFGFLELGTVTPRPQEGNPKPRLFRFPEHGAVINRMGFNNDGADEAAARLADTARPIPVGINIGINKDVGAPESPAEYATAFTKLYPWGDYFCVNVSSPNTPGLRLLQEKLRLERILERIQNLNGDRKPVFVKLAPDLDPDTLRELLPLLRRLAAGVVCTNTTVSDSLKSDVLKDSESLQGGLSGAPLRELSTRMIRDVYRLTEGKLPIIGAGGVFSAEDAFQKICAGASAVQVWTGLIYRGPGLIQEINRGLSRLLSENKIRRLQDAVGRSHKDIRGEKTSV